MINFIFALRNLGPISFNRQHHFVCSLPKYIFQFELFNERLVCFYFWTNAYMILWKSFYHLDACDIYTWGASSKGTLGHGEETEELIPRVVESLLGRDIRLLACGTEHTLAVSGNLSSQLRLKKLKEQVLPENIQLFEHVTITGFNKLTVFHEAIIIWLFSHKKQPHWFSARRKLVVVLVVFVFRILASCHLSLWKII